MQADVTAGPDSDFVAAAAFGGARAGFVFRVGVTKASDIITTMVVVR